MKRDIKYDLVIIGASGFTGKLVVEYLLKEYGAVNKEFTWAIAGRNHDRDRGTPTGLANCEIFLRRQHVSPELREPAIHVLVPVQPGNEER